MTTTITNSTFYGPQVSAETSDAVGALAEAALANARAISDIANALGRLGGGSALVINGGSPPPPPEPWRGEGFYPASDRVDEGSAADDEPAGAAE